MEIKTANVIEWAARYDGPKFHALLCDPPYHLTTTKRFAKSTPKKEGYAMSADHQFGRLSRSGFMGKKWDGGDIAYRPETWAALAEHLHPGAFGMAFASARGWHRLAVAIEDAGLRIHPSIFGWSYGSGFPKATRIDTQVDAAAGAEREMVTVSRNGGPGGNSEHIGQISVDRPSGKTITTLPATPLAQAWQGHRYGLQCIKPALEPIIVFQKPYEGKPVDCITETGAGALNIDGGRIGTSESTKRPSGVNRGVYGKDDRRGMIRGGDNGRWPSNFLLQHVDDQPCARCSGKWAECPDCEGTGIVPGCRRVGTKRVRSTVGWTEKDRDVRMGIPIFNGGKVKRSTRSPMTYADSDGLEEVADWQCHESCPVRRLGEQSGESSYPRHRTKRSAHQWSGEFVGQEDITIDYSDKGTAARFFHQSDWSHEIAERLAMADPVRYCAKASRRERDVGLGKIELSLTTNADKWATNDRRSGTARQPTEWKQKSVRNPHPTIKPIALCRWLATLLLPPAEYAPRRLLVPFCGTGSEMIAAMLAGWEDIVGIEMDADTVAIARARFQHWFSRPYQLPLMSG